MDVTDPTSDIEKLSQPANAPKARERLVEFVQGDETRAAQVLSRLGSERTVDLKAVDAACRAVLGIPRKLKIDGDVDTVLDEADELAEEEDQVEAAGALRRYASLAYPDHPRAGIEWVYHLEFHVEDHDRALTEVSALLERIPNWANAHQFAGLLLMRHWEDFDRALPHITRVVELNPLEGAGWVMLAWARGVRNEGAAAVAAALEALECDRRASAGEDDGATRALAGLCLYLFGPDEERERRLAELAATLARGETTEGFGLTSLAAGAREHGHPESEWLERLALVVDNQAKAGTLKAWPAYQRAKQVAKQLPAWRPPPDPPEDTYSVGLITPPLGHHVPRLLHELGHWLNLQEHGTLGWFDGLEAESLAGWPVDDIARITAGAFAFLHLGDGSVIVLVNTGSETPPAVGYLDSEGDSRTLAGSLEEFLVLWSRGETTVPDLDDDDAKQGRKALAKWIASQGITPPEVPNFDFNAWLDTGDGSIGVAAQRNEQSAVTIPVADRSPTPIAARLGPKTQQLAAVMGLRADAPELIRYVTETLGKRAPLSTRNDDVHVTAPKFGVELLFSHTVHADAYPPIAKTDKSFVPYLTLAWLNPKLGEEPLGVPWKRSSLEDLSKVLGPPTEVRDNNQNVAWNLELDSVARTQLRFHLVRGELTVILEVLQARALEKFPDVTTGLFVAYAAERGLLDPARFQAHAELVGRVAARGAQGSEFVRCALSRGLWDDHLRNDREFRDFAYGWFHNMGNGWITRDLIEVFGRRQGPFDHDEPVLDDDTWAAVDRAAPLFDERFAQWL